jgi:hypothetical protein
VAEVILLDPDKDWPILLRPIPLRSITLRSITLRPILLRLIPLRSIPLHLIPLRLTPLRLICLTRINMLNLICSTCPNMFDTRSGKCFESLLDVRELESLLHILAVRILELDFSGLHCVPHDALNPNITK